MANTKITELAALTNPASADVLAAVDVSAGVTNKVSIADLMKSASSGTASAPGVAFDSDANTGIYSPGADQLALSVNGSEGVRLTNGGSLRIGQTSTDEPGNGNTTAGIGITAAGTGNYSATNIPGLRVNRNDSDGTAVTFLRQGNTVGTISVTTTATAYNTSSDYRLKENVTPVTDGITRLQQLKPSRFNFIADPTKTVDGFLAHEVQTIVPEAITGEKDAVDDEGNPLYQGIDQSKIVPLVVAALQEAIGEIESLKARVAALEAN